MPDQAPGLSPDTRAIIAALRESDQQRKADEDRKHAENTERIEALMDAQRSTQSQVERIARGFPGEDPEGHRRYHESLIEWRELRNKMIRDALTQAAKVGGLGAIGWVGYALWMAFKMEIMK